MGGAGVIVGDLTLNLGVRYFTGISVKEPWTCHNNIAFVVDFDKFAYLGRAFDDFARHD